MEHSILLRNFPINGGNIMFSSWRWKSISNDSPHSDWVKGKRLFSLRMQRVEIARKRGRHCSGMQRWKRSEEWTDGHFLSDSKESSAKAIRLFQQEREKLQGNRGARAEAVSASIRASKMHLHFYDSENSFAPYASSPNLSPILYGLTQYYRIHLSLFCQNVLFLPNSRLEYLTKGSEIFKEKTPLQSLWCESDKRLFRSFSSSLCLYLFGRRPKRQCNGSSGR